MLVLLLLSSSSSSCWEQFASSWLWSREQTRLKARNAHSRNANTHTLSCVQLRLVPLAALNLLAQTAQ